jgi:hypothetical protein
MLGSASGAGRLVQHDHEGPSADGRPVQGSATRSSSGAHLPRLAANAGPCVRWLVASPGEPVRTDSPLIAHHIGTRIVRCAEQQRARPDIPADRPPRPPCPAGRVRPIGPLARSAPPTGCSSRRRSSPAPSSISRCASSARSSRPLPSTGPGTSPSSSARTTWCHCSRCHAHRRLRAVHPVAPADPRQRAKADGGGGDSVAADHPVPLVLFGEPLPARPGVPCASCNARKGLSRRRR